MRASKQAKIDAVTAALTGAPRARFYDTVKLSWRNRVGRWLFPPHQPATSLQSVYYVRTFTELHLDWKDRLRVLVSGHVCISVMSETDVEVNQMKSSAGFHVAAPVVLARASLFP